MAPGDVASCLLYARHRSVAQECIGGPDDRRVRERVQSLGQQVLGGVEIIPFSEQVAVAKVMSKPPGKGVDGRPWNDLGCVRVHRRGPMKTTLHDMQPRQKGDGSEGRVRVARLAGGLDRRGNRLLARGAHIAADQIGGADIQ
jgi:hypothetical protein